MVHSQSTSVFDGFTVLPVGVYTINGMLNSGMSGQFALRFFPSMWKDPAFYFRWAWTVNWTIGLGTVLFAAFSVLLSEPRNERPFLIGLWVGYLIFGMIFPYHIYTHDYYQLPFIPIVALSMAPALNLLFERYFAHAPGLFLRLCLLGVVVVGLAVQGYAGARQILDSDYRNEPSFWADIGDKLGHHASVIGLTQDYGYRLAYWGWQSSSAWFTSDDINLRYLAGENIDVAQQFKDDVAGKQFFLVTMFGELDNQPVIKNLLYSDYPIFSETDEYIIFDLQHPLNQP
jgi:hypothetical protein